MRILLAEDDPISQRVAEAALERVGHEVEAVGDGATAWERMLADPERLLVTDWMMPGMDGIELVRRVRAGGFAAYVYIIVVTALDGADRTIEGIAAGADDYVAKPYDPRELVARVEVGGRIQRLERGLRDSRTQLRELATLDPATGLLSRRSILDRAHAEAARSADEEGSMSLALLALDGIEAVARQHGSTAADELLRALGAAIQGELRPYDALGRWAGEEVFAGIRWGGDELLLVIPGKDTEAAAAALEQLRTRLSKATLLVDGLGLLAPALRVRVAGTSLTRRREVGALIDDAAAALADARAATTGRVVVHQDGEPQQPAA